MKARDLGLVAMGFLLGVGIATTAMMMAAYDVQRTDAVIRGLRLRYGPRVQGQG